ncbi:hypothetical protein TIFTF001_003598 [Ficus carica]|uniref:Uncharacterized protein n=1 Tax=Ficus carica TaxID=3494 RepID=A0AA87ZGI3_FICCA|nr:hypothetical protein TIFTF001_003598 [Ficus carica]
MEIKPKFGTGKSHEVGFGVATAEATTAVVGERPARISSEACRRQMRLDWCRRGFLGSRNDNERCDLRAVVVV